MQGTSYLSLDLPVSCLVPKSPAPVATSGARRRRGQRGPLLSLSQASGEPVGPGASKAGDRGDRWAAGSLATLKGYPLRSQSCVPCREPPGPNPKPPAGTVARPSRRAYWGASTGSGHWVWVPGAVCSQLECWNVLVGSQAAVG